MTAGVHECARLLLDAGSAIALLQEHSSAIKRPVLEAGDKLLIGFDPAEYDSAL